eukprot:4184753-Pleurochrysis_carterae.AAC.1
MQRLRRHRARRALFHNLLEPSLHRAIAARQDGHVLVLVSQNLYLDVARAGAQSHQENRRAFHLVDHL